MFRMHDVVSFLQSHAVAFFVEQVSSVFRNQLLHQHGSKTSKSQQTVFQPPKKMDETTVKCFKPQEVSNSDWGMNVQKKDDEKYLYYKHPKW